MQVFWILFGVVFTLIVFIAGFLAFYGRADGKMDWRTVPMLGIATLMAAVIIWAVYNVHDAWVVITPVAKLWLVIELVAAPWSFALGHKARRKRVLAAANRK